jgi:hypothetical protein
VRKNYQRKERKSNHKFEVVRGQELLVRVPLPMAEVWAEMQTQVEELTGQAGVQILRAILDNEVTRRVGPPHRPNPTAGCVRWGKQAGYMVFAGQKIPLERPRSWVFANPVNHGRWPFLAQEIMRHHVIPVARRLGITKRIGWHTFRHTYSTLLRSTGAELKIMQELLRHSTIRVTLDTYTQAVTTEKRNAQEAVVALLFREKT